MSILNICFDIFVGICFFCCPLEKNNNIVKEHMDHGFTLSHLFSAYGIVCGIQVRCVASDLERKRICSCGRNGVLRLWEATINI